MSADTLTLAIAELEGQRMDSITTMRRVAQLLRLTAGKLDDQAEQLKASGNAVVDAQQIAAGGRPKRRQLQVVR